MSLLRVENLSIRFGGIKAVNDVGFEVIEGEVFTIIGPNGAGKTTIFNLISRLYAPTAGRILFGDIDLTRVAAARDRRPRHRAHVPEHRALRARHGARQPAHRPSLPPPHRSSGRPAFPAAGAARGARRARGGRAGDRPARSRALPRQPASPACPTACARWSSSAARSPWSRGCCSSTSRPPGSTSRRPTTWRGGSATSSRSSASPCSWSSTT